jgi:hypothetical protein
MTFKPNIIPLTGLVLAIGTMAHARAHFPAEFDDLTDEQRIECQIILEERQAETEAELSEGRATFESRFAEIEAAGAALSTDMPTRDSIDNGSIAIFSKA